MINRNICRKVAVVSLLLFAFACGKKPVAGFSWQPANPKAGEQVTFVNTSTDAKKYDWNLGNMKISSDKEPVTVYETAGEYIIDLTARNGMKSDTKTQTIKISP
jgi:PKD repeat protein